MLKKQFNKPYLIANLAIIGILLLLPYYIFDGKLFIGGDDTHLFYIYPDLFLKNIVSSAWFNFSSVGSYSPNFFLVPFLVILSFLHFFIQSNVVFSYLFFSLPLIGGLIFFQLFISSIIGRNEETKTSCLIGSLVYVFSPILITGQLENFLYSVWLIPLIPAILYFFIRYQQSGQKTNIVYAVLLSIVLSQAFFSIPWLLGLLMPLSCGVLLYFFQENTKKAQQLKRSILFFTAIFCSQAFWLIPFMYSFIGGSSSDFGAKILSADTANSFAATVEATSTGNIIYPLTNLFFRQIAFDFHWELSKVFTAVYDKTIIVSLIYVFILGAGLFIRTKFGSIQQKKVFLTFFLSLLVSLFLFTVNIGPFKDLFISLGNIPGFAMFRNGFDKFALGYIFIFSTTITISLFAIREHLLNRIGDRSVKINRQKFAILSVLLTVVIAINFAPIKQIVNKPLWTTTDIRTVSDIPAEYTKFMSAVKERVPSTSSILSLPYGASSYSIITGSNNKNVFAGRSPVQIFTGINDYSGSLSFSPDAAINLNDYLRRHDYTRLGNFFNVHNIRYAVVAKNIDPQVLSSYLFDQGVLTAQDDDFYRNMLGKKLYTSEKSNYELYEIKRTDGADSNIITALSSLYSYQPQKGNDINDIPRAIAELQALYGGAQSLTVGSMLGSKKIYRVPENKGLEMPAGNYNIFQSTPDVGSLHFDQTKSQLTLKKGVELEANNVQLPSSPPAVLGKFTDSSALKINNTFVDAGVLTNPGGYTIGQKDEVVLYEGAGGDLVKGASNIDRNWHREDCNSHDNQGLTKFKFDTQGVSLEATQDHNACIWGEYTIDASKVYRVQFDYQTNQKNMSANLTTGGSFSADKRPFVDAGDNQWHHFSEYVVPSLLDKKLRVYLYSGEAKGSAVARYRGVSVERYDALGPLNYQSYLSQAGASTTQMPADTTRIAIPIRYEEEPRALYEFSSWSRSDCNAVDEKSNTVQFTIGPDGSISLRGLGQHNACIYKTIKINPNDVYKIDLDYDQHKDKKYLYIGYGKTISPETVLLPTNGHLSKEIVPPPGATEITLYLYSGSQKVGVAETAYNKISISHYPKSTYGIYVIEQDSGNKNLLPVEVKKIKSHKYILKIKSVSTKYLFVQLNDSFNTGWHLTRVDGGAAASIDSRHVEINGFSNGWQIDIDEACRRENLCTKNADGSYNLELSAEFKPERLLYFGSFISGVILLACAIIMVRHFRSKSRGGN